ncbi:MAG: catalase [Firmicutes bacterium]|nr:catalase [Candidatus Colivicinus equi]
MEKKPFFYRLFGHFKTITKHKLLVQHLCFKCGLYYQGFMHDWSKYSPTEFFPGVKYFTGVKSPITVEKLDIGYSKAWLHHKGRNKHHWEYYIDRENNGTTLISRDMPFNYIIECALDKISATKVYRNPVCPYDFFTNSYEYHVMNKNTVRILSSLLLYLKENGEEKALQYYKELVQNWKKDHKFTI